MAVNRRLEQLERKTSDRAARLAVLQHPRTCTDCGTLVPPLDAAPPPHTLDIPRCDVCELRHLGAVYAIMEDSRAGPSWAFQRYMERHGVSQDEAVQRLRRLDPSDTPTCSEERLSLVAVAVADMGVDPTDQQAVKRFFEALALAWRRIGD